MPFQTAAAELSRFPPGLFGESGQRLVVLGRSLYFTGCYGASLRIERAGAGYFAVVQNRKF